MLWGKEEEGQRKQMGTGSKTPRGGFKSKSLGEFKVPLSEGFSTDVLVCSLMHTVKKWIHKG